MARVRLELSPGQDAIPGYRQIGQPFDTRVAGVAGLQRTALWKISFEVGRVDFNAMDLAWRSKPDYHPIMAWTTTPFCFPAVAHVDSTVRHNQVVPVPKKHIAAREHKPTIVNRCQIDIASAAFEPGPIRLNFTVDPEPCHATIGINHETQVRKPLIVLNGKRILCISRKW